MKKNNFLYRLRVFLLVFLFIFPCFSFLACGGGDGGSGGSGGGSGGDSSNPFNDIPSYTSPTDKGMVELSPSDGISLKYLYKPNNLVMYYPAIKAGIYNSAENILTNLVGEYSSDSIVDVYNAEYVDASTEKTSLSPFQTVSNTTYSQLFNGIPVLPNSTIAKNLSKAEFAYYNTTSKWYAIGPEDIPENFIRFSDSKYTIATSGTITDLTTGDTTLDAPAGTEIDANKIYSFRKGSGTFYLWVGETVTNLITTVGGGGKSFTEKLFDTHYNAINRSIVNVEGENGAIVITKEKWEWCLEDWTTLTFLEAYLEEYKNKLAIEIARINAYGTAELKENTKLLYEAAIANPDTNADNFIDDCVLRIDHIGVSEDEANLITDFITENVIGTRIMEKDNVKYSYSGGSSDRFYANEIADGVKRNLVTVNETDGSITFNNKVVVDVPTADTYENGFGRVALFKNYYNTTRASLERTRLVYPETPIVDYVDVAYNAGTGEEGGAGDDEETDWEDIGNMDVFDVTWEEPANGKIQSIVITNLNATDLDIASISFMISSIHDEDHSKWTVDTLDIYIYANYYHNGKLEQFSLDSMFLSKEDPNNENGIDSKYGTLVEKTYNIWDINDAPAFINKKLTLSQNTHTELDTEDWGGLKDGNADDIDKKNSVVENTFKNFRSVNRGFGNSASYNGGGDYLEFCFVVNGEDATLLDFYNYSITISGLYGKQV